MVRPSYRKRAITRKQYLKPVCSRWPPVLFMKTVTISTILIDLFDQTYRLTSDKQCKLYHGYTEWLTQCKCTLKSISGVTTTQPVPAACQWLSVPILMEHAYPGLWSWSNKTRLCITFLQTTGSCKHIYMYTCTCSTADAPAIAVSATLGLCVVYSTCSGSPQTMFTFV